MRVQAFIPDWDNPTTDAELLYRQLSEFCPTQILKRRNVASAYQWQEMLEKFDADVALWMMADVRLPNMKEMFPEMMRLLSRPDIAIYAPFIDWQISMDASRPQTYGAIEPEVYEVKINDGAMFAVTSKLLSLLPPFIPEDNPQCCYYTTFMAMYARRNGLKVVRDYRFRAKHPYGSSWNCCEGLRQSQVWVANLPSQDNDEMMRIFDVARMMKESI